MQSSIMWQYIMQEPEVLTGLMQSTQTEEFAAEKGRRLKTIYFVAHGSSFNAAVSVAGFFSKKAHIRAYAYTPGNFYTLGNAITQEDPESTLVVIISQTGTSTGALKILEYVSILGFKTLGITGVCGSPIADKADDVLYLMCGEENSNAKTKGYSATILLLLLLAVSIGYHNGTLDSIEKQVCLNELEGMIKKIPEVFEQAIEFCRQTEFGSAMKNLYVLGSGMNFGTAQEGQLKLMETMCIPTMFNDIGEFSHGMHRAIDSDSNLLLIRTNDCLKDQVEQSYQYLKGISDHVWMIDASGEKSSDASCFCIPSFVNTQSLLLTTLFIQVLSVYAPEYNGLDPNRDAHNDFTLIAGTRV